MPPSLPDDGRNPGLVRGPKWRTRTNPQRRHRLAAVTFALIVAVGVAIMWCAMWALAALGAPRWVVALPWIVPTIGAVMKNVGRPRPAPLTDDDDDTWPGYAIRWAMAGELEPRPAPARVVTAVLFGAPVAWAVLVPGVLTIIGLT